jgi:hypothetical protein
MVSSQKLSYTLEEAQHVTGFARSRLYQAIAEGVLLTFKAGRRRMVSRKALEDFISKMEKQGRAA